MNVLPELLGTKVLIKVIEKRFTKGGLVLPESIGEKNPQLIIKEATVLKTGPGTLLMDGKYVPCCVKGGDKIYVNAANIAKVEIGDTEYGLVREDLIIAYFPKSEE